MVDMLTVASHAKTSEANQSKVADICIYLGFIKQAQQNS